MSPTHKDKLIKDIPRFCKYTHCRKLLPKDCHHQKRYCVDTDCYSKQNKIEQKERRDKLRANKPKKFRTCNFDECKKSFEVDPKAPLKAYCDDECRNANHKKVQAKRWEQEQIKIVAKREERVQATIAETGTKSGIAKRFLVRGTISNHKTASAISVSA